MGLRMVQDALVSICHERSPHAKGKMTPADSGEDFRRVSMEKNVLHKFCTIKSAKLRCVLKKWANTRAAATNGMV